MEVQAFRPDSWRERPWSAITPRRGEVLNGLNVQPLNIFLLTVKHCRLCSWAQDFRNCM